MTCQGILMREFSDSHARYPSRSPSFRNDGWRCFPSGIGSGLDERPKVSGTGCDKSNEL